jgi:hypothetical protein
MMPPIFDALPSFGMEALGQEAESAIVHRSGADMALAQAW